MARRARVQEPPPPPPPEPEVYIPPPPPPEIYSRLIYILPYNSPDLVERIQTVFEQYNCRALNLEHVSRSALAARVLSSEELSNKELDIITGFELIDSQFRVYVFEGMPLGGIQYLNESIPREQKNTTQFTILSNSDIKFNQRLYLEFGASLKMIKLREPLASILMNPDLYIRAKVSEDLMNTLHKLIEIRRAGRLNLVKDFNLCPNTESLSVIERKYGDALTYEDLYGKPETVKKKVRLRNPSTSPDAAPRASNVSQTSMFSRMEDDKSVAQTKYSVASKAGVSFEKPTPEIRQRSKCKPETDHKNFAFEEKIKKRAEEGPKNFNGTYKEQVKYQSDINKLSKPDDKVRIDPGNSEVYIYSGQKLNSTEILKQQMAEEYAKDKNHFYSQSTDHLTLAWPVVDEDQLKRENDKKFTKSTLKTKI